MSDLRSIGFRTVDEFTLGDLDLGTHLARTHYLRSGLPLSSVVPLLTSRWDIGVTLLPSTDSEVETHVVTDQPTARALVAAK